MKLLSVWWDLLTLSWLTGSDGRASFTKLSVIALYAWLFRTITPQVTWTFLVFVVLLALIPFGLRGLNLFAKYFAAKVPGGDG